MRKILFILMLAFLSSCVTKDKYVLSHSRAKNYGNNKHKFHGCYVNNTNIPKRPFVFY